MDQKKIPGVVRWAVNFEKWKPEQEEWDKILEIIEPEEKARILRFKRPLNGTLITGRHNPDAKSACLGRLLLRMLVHKELGIPYKDIQFARTKEGKPFLVNDSKKFPNFNFNISHAGSFVTLGSEPCDIIGVDVMEMEVPRRDTDSDVLEFFSNMESCFTTNEWKNINAPSDLQKQIENFFIHWTLKEGYIKAVGIGLGFELQRAEFKVNIKDKEQNRGSTATVKIDGKDRNEWKFGLDYLDNNHVTAVAIGPPSEAILSFLQTMHSKKSSIEDNAIDHVTQPFQILTIKDLLPN